ncbi:MAG TPA: GNAT family N-acetyltransferase [Candidatus Binatia bacterium]|jgi:RimJ/RimL family protein N-acetyltransferase
MSNLLIREARLNDAPVLLAAEKETARTPGLLVSRPHELSLQAFEQKIVELGERGRYIVAEKDGRIAGHALLDPMPLEAISHVFRLTIVVHPKFTGHRVGTALMAELMEWAKRSPKLRKIELLVRATNERAVQLYFKLGFIEEGGFQKRICLPDGNFIDDLAMAWFPEPARPPVTG